MTRAIRMCLGVAVLLAGCAGRDAPPVDAHAPYDEQSLASSQQLWPECPYTGSPKNLPELQKTEWRIGNTVAVAESCGYRDIAAKVRTFMIKSPCFKAGLDQGRSFIGSYTMTRCGRPKATLEKELKQKDQWEKHLNTTYPNQ